MTQDVEFLARRVAQERESAERTQDSIAKRVHQEMAERYAARLQEIAPVQRVSA